MKKKLVVAIAMMIMMVMAFAGTAFAAYNDLELGTTTANIPVRHGVDDTAGAKFIFKAPEDGIYTFDYVLKVPGDLEIIRNYAEDLGTYSPFPESLPEFRYAVYLEKNNVEKLTVFSTEIIAENEEDIDKAEFEVTVNKVVTPDTELVMDDADRVTPDGNVRISLVTYGEKMSFANEDIYPYNVESIVTVNEPVNGEDYFKSYDLHLSREDHESGKEYRICNAAGSFFDFFNLKVGTGKMYFYFNDNGLAKIMNAEAGRELNYTIVPADVRVKSVTADTGKITVKADKKLEATGAAKFKIAYRVKGTTTWKYVTTTSQTKTIKNLKKGKAYQVKIKAIKTVKDVPYEGEWSKIKTSAQVK